MERYFTIQELSSISGIKPHTIRMWEKRYNLLHPERTGSNIRKYKDHQLRKLINVATLLDQGGKISQIAGLDTGEMEKRTKALSETLSASEASLLYIEELVRSMKEMDENRFERVFSKCVLRYGLEDTFVEVIYPFLSRVGIMWCSDEILPAHEHFITSLIKQKLFTAADGRGHSEEFDSTWLLAMPHGEYHEIGLLLGHYLIRNNDHRSIYLGQDVPYMNLKPTAELSGATHFLTLIIKRREPEWITMYLKELERDFPNVELFVAIKEGMVDERQHPSINFLHDINQLMRHI
ncbi:MAG: MerR family transcriptional regulator [Flavobacteriales bacterium]|nr:MerR family transcriptional regulator [Bacteroidota bacterium]MCB9240483.1 MerR family transcriptional regulator [Flavobacteriales bacterium]